MDVEELLAREEIRRLLATYTMAGDRGDYVTMASVFAEDGVLDGQSHRVGRKAIIQSLAARPMTKTGPDRKMGFSRHNLSTSLVTFEDERTARGRTYFMMVTEVGLDHTGVYVDRFEKADGAWRIRHRNVRIDWAAETGHVRSTRPTTPTAT